MKGNERPIIAASLLAGLLLLAGPHEREALAGEPLRSVERMTFPQLDQQRAQGNMEELFGEEEADVGDPLELLNRFFFAFNETLDVFVVRPAAVTYRFWLPQGVRDSVRNFLRNLSEPVVLVNDLLQGNGRRAEVAGSRFLINTAIGFGFFDPAEGLGLPYHSEDFGQTLAVWGLGSGPYLVLPILGPSTLRDAAGKGVDFVIDPITYIDDPEALPFVRSGASTLDWRSRNIETLDEVQRDALDYYARIRSLYIQRRQQEILNRDGSGPELVLKPDHEK